MPGPRGTPSTKRRRPCAAACRPGVHGGDWPGLRRLCQDWACSGCIPAWAGSQDDLDCLGADHVPAGGAGPLCGLTLVCVCRRSVCAGSGRQVEGCCVSAAHPAGHDTTLRTPHNHALCRAVRDGCWHHVGSAQLAPPLHRLSGRGGTHSRAAPAVCPQVLSTAALQARLGRSCLAWQERWLTRKASSAVPRLT